MVRLEIRNLSTRLLKRRVRQFGPATIGRKVKSGGSYILTYSLF